MDYFFQIIEPHTDNILIVLFVCILLGLIYWIFPRKPKFSRKYAQRIVRSIEATSNLSPDHGIMEVHKIFIAALMELFRENPKRTKAADLMRRISKRLPNSDQVWRIHRLRNRIAHETSVHVSCTQFDLARRDILRAIASLTV